MLSQISENFQKGKAKIVKQLVQEAIDAGIPAQDPLPFEAFIGLQALRGCGQAVQLHQLTQALRKG